MYVRAGRPGFARPCEGVHRNTSLMSSSLLLQQCLAYVVRLTLIVFVMGGTWPYSSWLWSVGSRICSILLAAFLYSCCQAFSPPVSLVTMLCIHTAVSTWSLLGRNCVSFFGQFWPPMTDSLLIAVHAFACRVSMSVSFKNVNYKRCLQIIYIYI